MRATLPDGPDQRDSRAVSDLVAFVLTFSVIITAAAAVSIGGVGTLEDFRDQARVDSAEVAMTGFDSSMEDIRVDGVPQRSHQLNLNGDQLERHHSKLEIRISGTPAPDPRTFTVDVGAFVRKTSHGTELVYETGTVYRSQDRGQVVVREPPLRCGPDAAHLGLVSVQGDVNVSSDSLALRARQTDSESVYPGLTAGENGTATGVEIRITDTYNDDAWRQFLDDSSNGWEPAAGPDWYACTGVDRVYVHNTTVDLTAVN